MKESKSFEFPERLLGQIDENSLGGFILFTINDKGIPQAHCHFDSSIIGLGLQKFVLNWSESINALHKEAIANGIKSQIPSGQSDS